MLLAGVLLRVRPFAPPPPRVLHAVRLRAHQRGRAAAVEAPARAQDAAAQAQGGGAVAGGARHGGEDARKRSVTLCEHII